MFKDLNICRKKTLILFDYGYFHQNFVSKWNLKPQILIRKQNKIDHPLM